MCETLAGQVDTLEKEVRHAEEMMVIARDRAKYVRDIETAGSYYESWFSIGRPIRPEMAPILLGIALFIFIVAAFIFLKMMNVEFSLFVADTSKMAKKGSLFGTIFMMFPTSFWVVLTALILVLVYYRKR